MIFQSLSLLYSWKTMAPACWARRPLTDWTCQHTSAGSLANIWCQGQYLPSFNACSASSIYLFIQQAIRLHGAKPLCSPYGLLNIRAVENNFQTKPSNPYFTYSCCSYKRKKRIDTQIYIGNIVLCVTHNIYIWEYIINNVHIIWETCSILSNLGIHHVNVLVFLLLLRGFYEQKGLFRIFFNY